MTKHKVSELEGELLDAAVAKTLGWKVSEEHGLHDGYPVWLTGDKESPTYTLFKPSFRWQCAGPIIERERICLQSPDQAQADVGRGEWYAGLPASWGNGRGTGPTPLIAAMRAYVASKFGDEVELP